MARHPTPLQRQLRLLWYAVDNAGGPSATGPKGDKGDKGDTGDTGPAGADGAPGADGQSGAKGDTGERGETGLQGPVGNDGNDGSDGVPGDDGPSAYDVAIVDGFVGTEAQWLASLVGAKGDKGDKGDTGDAGAAGLPGANGSDGNDGAAGTQGIQGVKGDTGIAGTDASVTNANVNTAIADNRPATKTALLLVKADVGLGSVDNTADSAKAVLTAVKLATARTINGVSFDGSAGITINAVDSTARVATTRSISTTAPLTGGGDLSADRTLAISAATSGAAGSMSAADKTKLDGVATGATANSSDATLLARANHTGTQAVSTILAAATARFFGRITASGGAGEEMTGTQATTLLDLATGALKGLLSAADFTKLAGIASGATANSTDATLLARANHTGTQTLDTTTDSATRLAMTAAERTKLSGIATSATANSTDAALSAAYRTLLDSSGSHTAAKVAGTYGLGQGDLLAVSGTGILYPLNVIYIDAADYPAIGALAAKLRVRCIIEANDVAPTGNFTAGLHAVTRPGTSGGAGLCIYTMAAAIAGSTATQTTPAADSQSIITSADFGVPATGFYVLGVVTTGTIATSAHMHFSAQLQMRYA